jgi:Ca-activated chloride channel family protein
MSGVVVAELVPMDEARVALEDVKVEATLRGLCSETQMSQSYRNLENRNIEVAYTFPLPLDAVLLELTLELNNKILRGMVTAKKEAEEHYEQAIDSGDSAVLLRQVEPGIYSVSIGNILPGERAVIRYRYSQLHHWQGDNLRFQLPTTIAPRYGNPLSRGMMEHELPEHSLTVDHGFALQLCIEGTLAQADFECPSHAIGISQENNIRVLRLAGGAALMDRDFVLILKETAQTEPQGYWASDKDDYVALASFHPRYPGEPGIQHKVVKLVVDCSGSMNGDAMRQAKVAVSEILDSLSEADLFNITTFGSHYRLLFSKPKPADHYHLQVAKRYIKSMDANMGGTEIGAALQATYQARTSKEESADILLITDGEIWEQASIIKDAKQSSHRIFSVGVGSAVSEGFVHEIAHVTHGASELVSPRENMAEHIVRHFQRIHQPRATVIEVAWPEEVHYQSPEVIQGVYSGDTLHLFAHLDAAPSGPVVLKVSYEDGQQAEHAMKLLPAEQATGFQMALPRLAANARLESLDSQAAQSLAVAYQLVTELTSCVLVFERKKSEKAEQTPELRKVPQMMPAGWGGLGSVDRDGVFDIAGKADGYAEPLPCASTVGFINSCPSAPDADALDYLEAPAYKEQKVDGNLRKRKSRMKPKLREKQVSIDVLDVLPFGVLEALRANGVETIKDLIALTQEALLALDGIDEADVVQIIKALKAKGWRLKKKSVVSKISSVFSK